MSPGQPLVDVMARPAAPQIASALRAVSVDVLHRWEQAVHEALPTADAPTLDHLRAILPSIVDHLAGALDDLSEGRGGHASRDGDAATRSATPASPDAHARRASTTETPPVPSVYNLGDALTAFSLLRSVMVERVCAAIDRDLTGAESMKLHLALDHAARQSAISVCDHQTSRHQATNEAQSKYLSFLSHDLRGGLNGIFLMIEVLKRELAGQEALAETLQDLDMMRRSILEMVGVMDRFLHAERFRKGKVQVKLAPVSLNSLLRETAAAFTYQAREKGIELRVDAPRDSTAWSDRELLGLIFQNLVSNAVKYTPCGAVQIKACPTDERPGWRVEVIDQGPGIAPEKLADLFQGFTRGLTYGQPGVGLGLTIAHYAAQLLGVRLSARSEPGEGSTFSVELPPESAIAETAAAAVG